MSDNRKYYYLKLKENYFDEDAIVLLESMQDGILYSNNYLKALFAIGFQGFLIMICVGIYAVLVNSMIIADNLHSAIFSLASYTVILCFSLFKTGTLAKSIFNAH